jgi:riboflavin kinase/FMN adenylyltransferase
MEILNQTSNFPKQVSLILGFFDGLHLGHRELILQAPSNTEKVLVTFSKSPAEYFTPEFSYIYPREISYSIAEKLGINDILEYNFSEILNISAEDYLNNLVENFEPKYILSGFNHTFGKNKLGNAKFLKEKQQEYNYKYICVPEYKKDGKTVSSTYIKELLANGEIPKANTFLGENFKIKSKVIKGARIGRTIGFPTANMKYPKDIIRIPYGVYCVKAFNMPAVLNWGVKPTVDGKEEVLEIHIPNWEKDLYEKELEIEIIDKIRDEQKFKNLEELKTQIKKDVKKCLELS